MKQRIKQYQRHSQQNLQIERVPYESQAEIDAKFQELLIEQSTDFVKLSSQPKSQQRRLAVNTKRTIKQSQALEGSQHVQTPRSTIDEIVETQQNTDLAIKPQQEQFFQFFVERYFTHQPKLVEQPVQTYNDNVHFLITQHGDFLSNSLISSLIIVSLKEHFGSSVPLYDHYGTAQRLLHNMNVSPVVLSQLQTAAERQEYILKQFEQTLHMLMTDWRVKIAQKDKKLQDYDNQHQNDKQKMNQQQNDIFKWLQLKTRYQTLQKKLREMLMEKMNEYENQLSLIQAVKQGKRVALKGITKVTTKQIIKPEINQQGKQIQDQQLIWNENLEKKFLKERTRSKKAYNAAIKASSFNEMGFKALFDELEMDDPIHLQRDDMMSKYRNGEWLTQQEMQFLVNTSELLNRCVDKNVVNTYVTHIKPVQIDSLETMLAEQILQNHHLMKDKIHQSRASWLLQNNTITKQKILIHDKKLEDQKIQAQQLVKHAKLKKTLAVVCNKLKVNISIKDQVYRNVFAMIFVRKVMLKVEFLRRLKEERNIRMDDTYLKQKEKRLQTKIRIKQLSQPKTYEQPIKRKYHPSSKVGFVPIGKLDYEDLQTLEGQQLQNRQQIMKQKQSEYRLQILDVGNNKKESFVNFYSTGPNKAFRQTPIFNPTDPTMPPQLTNKELQSIIKIQKAVRKHISRRRLQNYKEITYQKKFRSYYAKLESLTQGRRFEGAVQQQTIKLRTQSSRGNRLRSEASTSRFSLMASALKVKTNMKTEETAEGSSLCGSKIGRTFTATSPVQQVAHKLVKHERLLRYCKLNQTKQILKSGFYYERKDVDVTDDDQNTSLYYAATHGNIRLCEYLLRLGANPNQSCKDGNTPMHMAVQCQNIEVILYCMDFGGSLNIANKYLYTPLAYATPMILKQLGMEKGIVTARDYIPNNDALLFREEQDLEQLS